ncbi:MAG TPA: HepT-like ribonuclease domain-containing protein [Thermomicrobiales bacterium]|nr:HepT-like ribonuclease domain-containing protein [Thermomicrobiales bacterium]
MQHRTPNYLEDIRDAATFILDVTAQESLTSYRASRLPRQAIERNFEIIGEAVRRLDQLDPRLRAEAEALLAEAGS